MKPILLAPYLEQFDLWNHLAEMVQQVTQDPIEKVNRYISWLRDQYITEDAANAKIEAGEMLSQSDFSNWDPETVIRHVQLQGFTFKNARVLTSDDYLRMYRNLPQYWYKQGTENFIDFFSFAFNTPFLLTNLWTQDYVTFLPEGDPGIGTPINAGGTWYPTTHVQLQYDGIKYGGFSYADIVAFFYYFANYNLVLKYLVSQSDLPFQDLGLTSAFQETVIWNIEMDGVLRSQTIFYQENKTADAVVGTFQVSDSYSAFRFADTGTHLSADGYFQISDAGVVTITAAGVASSANNFEASPASVVYPVEAHQSITGLWVGPVNLTLTKTDQDEQAPVVAASQSFSYVENQSAGYVIGTVLATDDVGVTGWRFGVSGNAVSADGNFQISSTGALSLTNQGAAVPPTSEQSTFSTAVVQRFTPKYWRVDGPRSMSFALTTTGTNLRVDYVARKANDICGVVWDSEDLKDHRLLKYQTKRDYRNVVLDFDIAVSTNQPVLNEPTQALSLTVEGRDQNGEAVSYIIALFRYADLPATRAAHIHIDFSTVMAGFNADQPTYMGDVDRMFIAVIDSSYNQLDQPINPGAPQVSTGWMTLGSVAASGSNSTMTVGTAAVPAHSLGMCTSYDDSYDLSPERVVAATYALGYRTRINHYCGMSIFPHKTWTGAGFTQVNPGSPDVVNTATKAWHSDFLAKASALGYTVIQSVSFEVYFDYANQAWVQRDWNDNIGYTGYTPPSYLLSPCNTTAQAWLHQAHVEFATLANTLGIPVYMQVGEPWWWVQPETRKACIYDFQTKTAFNAATGLFAADGGTVDAPATGSPHDQYKTFVQNALGQAVEDIRTAIRTAIPTAQVSVLPFLPTILDNAYTAVINLPTAHYVYPKFDFFQTEAYDYFIGTVSGDPTVAMTYPLTTLGYPANKVEYLAGFAPETPPIGQTRATIWRRIMENINAFQAYGIAKLYIWAYPLVMRDSLTFRESGTNRWYFQDSAPAVVNPAGANDFEAAVHSFTPQVQARDAAGNWSTAIPVSIAVTNRDDVMPVVVAAQIITYPENRAAGTVIGTISSSDDVAVTGFRFAITLGPVSPDSYYSITSSGQVILTAVGATGAANDYESLPNVFGYLIQARDAAGNWSLPVELRFRVTDIDEVAPVVTSGQTFNYPENSASGAVVGTVAATDNLAVTGFRFAISLGPVTSDGFYQISSAGVITLTAAGAADAAHNDFETLPNSWSYNVQARDAAGNWSAAVAVSINLTDVSEIPNVNWLTTLSSNSETRVHPSSLGGIAYEFNDTPFGVLDDTGTPRWQKTFTSSVFSGYMTYWAGNAGGNTIIAAEAWAPTGSQEAVILAAMDSTTGALQWSKVIDSDTSNPDVPGRVLGKDGYIYVSVNPENFGTGVFKAGIVKFDTSGVLQWGKQFSMAGVTPHVEVQNFDVAPDGSVYVGLRLFDSGTSTYYYNLAKLDSSGAQVWQRNFAELGGDKFNLRVLSDNRPVIVQTTTDNTKTVLLVLNASTGATSFARKLSGAGGITTSGNGCAVDSADNIYVAAMTTDVAATVVAKYNSSGVLQWTRTLTVPGGFVSWEMLEVRNLSLYIAHQGTNTVLINVPTDGTKTGTYVNNGVSVTWQSGTGSLVDSDAAANVTNTASTLATLGANPFTISNGDIVLASSASPSWYATPTSI
jgi:hypothetical protein